MATRTLLVCLLVLLLGCEVKEKKETAAKPLEKEKAEAASPAPYLLVSAKDDFAKGMLKGTQLLPEGTIALVRKNLLINSSFERDDEEGAGIRDGLAHHWGLWGKDKVYHTYSDNSVPYLPNEATHGSRSQRIELKAVGKTEMSLSQEARDVPRGRPYTFSADVKVDEAKQLEAAVSLQFYGGGKWLFAKTSDYASPTAFTRLAVTGIMPETSDAVRAVVQVRPKAENAVGTVWIDAAQLEQSEKPTPYTPG